MENEITIDKIIEKSNQWTLEGDCTLLQWMNQISKNLEERVTKTSSDIINMSTKLDRTSIALSNATNNLAALQYSKFVENRVHEDDETLANTANVPSEDVTDRKNSGQDIYSFLKKNIEMMNSCHEAYSFSYEDSEDDDDDDDDDDEPVTSVVYRSKNPYEARPLPHIYGSIMWKEKWHIGLCDSDNDFSNEENSEQFSESSSTADDSNESTAPTMSEWDSTAWGLNTQHNIERKDMHTPSNDGESSYQGEDYSQSKVSTPRTQKRVPIAQQPIQDQRYYQHVPRQQENMVDDIFDDSKPQEVTAKVIPPQVISSNVIPAPLKKVIPESYIPNEPPPDEQSIESEGNRRVGAKKTLNLFDDDEFSSFMDQIVEKATNKNIKPNEQSQENSEPPKTALAANLFNDHISPDDDSQRQPKKALAPNIFDESNAYKQKQPIKVLAPNLFSDSDDLFSPPTEKVQGLSKNILAPNLFNDSDDLFTPSISEQPIVRRKSSSSKLEDDIFTASPKSVAIIGKTKIKNLFDDDDEDDDFDNIFSSKPSTSTTFHQATKNLFSDDLTVEPENNESIKEVPTTSPEFIKQGKNNFVLKNENTNVQKNIFYDGGHISPIVEKEISYGNPVLKEGSLPKKGLFDDFDELADENNIFSTKQTKKDPFENLFQKEKPDNKFSTIESKSLFGDEDEKEDNDRNESKRSEVVEENIENNPNDSGNIPNFSGDPLTIGPPDDIFTPTLSMKKTQVDDIFADEVDDDFENFISSNPSKSSKVNEFTEVPELSTKSIENVTLPVNAPNPTEPATMSLTAPRLPIIAQKPLVDKTSKPQNKVMPTKNVKSNLSEKTDDENGSNSNSKAKKHETDKSSSSHSEDPCSNLEPQDAPQLSVTEKTQVASSSKQSCILDLNLSESSKISVSKENQIADKQIYVEEDNTQTKTVLKTDEEILKPIPKPKPKVIIEYDTISSPSKDITDKNSLADQSAKKTSTIPSYTSLFHDDIPPEDENPNPTLNEESPLHTVEEDVEAKPISSASSVPYSSINLFADVPPDDYLSVSTRPMVQTNRIHSVFYDDFNETIEAGREMRTPPSYMINDEPPPDDNKDNKPVISEVKKEKPQVSKLKKLDFQINVGALMPSAKLPSFKKPQAVEKSQSEIKINEQNSPSLNSAINKDFVASQSQLAVKTRELPENILPNLNKDRVKVQVKRRPSTRMARRENYMKSMIEETVSIDNQEDEEIKKSISSSEKQKKGIIVANQKISKDKDEIMEQQKPPESSPPFEDLGTFDKKQEINKESNEALNKMPDQATLFEESDILFNKSVTSSSSSKATTTKIPSLFKNSDSETENLFVETIKSNTKKSELEPSPMTKNLDSLFDSDEIDENPFGTPKIFLPHPTTSKEKNQPTEEKSKLDLLFESAQPKESKDQPVKSAIKPTEQSPKTTPKSLFGDSDDGSDDLFKEAIVSKKAVIHRKPEQKPKTKQAKVSASLFSSDEDSGSGNDLFGKPRTNTRTKKHEPPVKDKDKASSNLFADLSDDDSDGLFGTSTKVNKSKSNPPKNRLQSTKEPAPAAAQQEKSISNNPLSDLLGP